MHLLAQLLKLSLTPLPHPVSDPSFNSTASDSAFLLVHHYNFNKLKLLQIRSGARPDTMFEKLR